MLARVIGLLCGYSLSMETFSSGGKRKAQNNGEANTTHHPRETQIVIILKRLLAKVLQAEITAGEEKAVWWSLLQVVQGAPGFTL